MLLQVNSRYTKLNTEYDTMAQINVRIPDDQKERWDQAVKVDYKASNLTNLIKISVEEYIENHDLNVDG